MAKTHTSPCAEGTIRYANKAPPYGGSQLSIQHTHPHVHTHPPTYTHPHVHTQKHVYIEKPSAVLHFHAKSAKPCNGYLYLVCGEGKKRGRETREKENERRGQEMDREERSRRSIEEIRETSQYCLLLLLISIQ